LYTLRFVIATQLWHNHLVTLASLGLHKVNLGLPGSMVPLPASLVLLDSILRLVIRARMVNQATAQEASEA